VWVLVQEIKNIMIRILFIVLIGLQSCGVNYHLKRAKHHQEKAIEKGAVVTSDTIFQTTTVTIPERVTDTLIQNVSFRDTITITKDRIVTKVKINLRDSAVYVAVKCPEEKKEVKTAAIVNTTIEAKPGFWKRLKWYLIVGAIAFAGGYFVRSRNNFQVTIRNDKAPNDNV
jgi:hypothetical protein